MGGGQVEHLVECISRVFVRADGMPLLALGQLRPVALACTSLENTGRSTGRPDWPTRLGNRPGSSEGKDRIDDLNMFVVGSLALTVLRSTNAHMAFWILSCPPVFVDQNV